MTTESSEDPSRIPTLERRIAELEQQLGRAQGEDALLQERIKELEERRLGVSLDGIKSQLGHVDKRLGQVESRRDAWLRTLVLTLAVPVAAGIFGQCDLKRDVELKRFEQNLALVDRALDSSKGEAYRRSVLDYIAALNREDEDEEADTPIARWAIGERDKLDVTIEALEGKAAAQQKVVEQKQSELVDAREKIVSLTSEVAEASAAPTSDVAAQQANIQQLDDKITQIHATVEQAKTAKAELETQAAIANDLADRVGHTPIVQPSNFAVPELAPPLPGVINTEPSYAVQAGSYGALAAAQARVDKLVAKGIEAFVLHRRKYFVVMAGPYPTESEAAQKLGVHDKDFDAGARVRRMAEFCPRQLPVGDDVQLCVE
jgi:chromosome segregation ATPase